VHGTGNAWIEGMDRTQDFDWALWMPVLNMGLWSIVFTNPLQIQIEKIGSAFLQYRFKIVIG